MRMIDLVKQPAHNYCQVCGSEYQIREHGTIMKYPLTLLVVGACCVFVLRMQQFQVHNITRHYLTLNNNSTHNNLVADSNGGDLEEEHPLPCVLTSHPKPMILMSLGRSGTCKNIICYITIIIIILASM